MARLSLVIKIFTIIIILIFINSCEDIFSVRNAEDPVNISGKIISLSPLELFENFEKTLIESNEQGYSSLFSDSLLNGFAFSFIPESEYLPDFYEWNNKSEENFAENLFESHYFSDLIISGSDIDQLNETEEDSLFIDFSYEGMIVNLENDSIDLSGNSRFLIKKINSFWYVIKWFDEKGNENSDNFTTLKLRF